MLTTYNDSARSLELAQRVRGFVEREVIPLEAARHGGELAPATVQGLRDRARAEGLYGPQIGMEWGGLGLPLREVVPIFEAAGRSLLGPLALHCAAPDEGNLHTLALAANPAQRERFLRPLAEGRVRSAFAMTEPAPGAGSDPTMIRTTARREGDGWVLDGHKWFTSGADGAAFFLVMARSDPVAHPYKGCTIFLVEASTPGLTVERRIPVMGAEAPGGHCEVRLTDCHVPHAAILGAEGDGFRIAQRRLGPARLTHCMRWTGVAERALEVAIDYAKRREAFGEPLAEKQAIQWMLADSVMELHAGKLLVRHAADRLSTGDDARTETAMAKVHVSETVHRVVDRAIQICGAAGISYDLPLAEFYQEARAFRIYDGASEVHRRSIAREVLGG